MVTISEKEYKELVAFIRINFGIDLGTKKQALVNGRLQNILLENDFSSFTEYFQYLTSDLTGEGLEELINKITTNHTYFLREVDHFYYFRDNILLYLSNNLKNKDIRIWSAGCSSGEEPYTLAMIIDEFFGKSKVFWDAKILATDISSEVINTAVKGEYSNEDLDVVPINWRINYLTKLDDNTSVFINKIRDEIIFRKFNLMQNVFPFKSKFHVIFCRNVMIYFDNGTRSNLINKFYDSLEFGGYLIIGHSEALNREKTKFKYVKPGVYRKE